MVSLLKIPHLSGLSSPECISNPAGYVTDKWMQFRLHFAPEKGKGYVSFKQRTVTSTA